MQAQLDDSRVDLPAVHAMKIEKATGRVVDIDGALIHRPEGSYSAGESVAIHVELSADVDEVRPLVLRSTGDRRETRITEGEEQ
jgi:hypothetical protein